MPEAPTQQPPTPMTPDGAKLPPPTELRERGERPALDGPDAVEALGRRQPTSAADRSSALDWFLSEAPEDNDEITKVIELNVGSTEKERWIKWTIRAVDVDTLRRINKMTTARRGKEDVAADLAQLRVIVAGTVDPDLRAVAQQMGIADPAMAVRKRFSFKPGLVSQIASRVLELSGFDDEDVREAAAAGN